MLKQIRLDRKKGGTLFNVMITGHASAGKTSLINHLTKSLTTDDDNHGPTFVERVVTSTINEMEPEKEIMSGNNKSRLKVQLIDTPGIRIPDRNPMMSNNNSHVNLQETIDSPTEAWFHSIDDYLEKQYNGFFQEETKIKRNTRQADKRVHACIYMLDPHICAEGLSVADRRVLKQLSAKVNVILTLGKADSLSMKERERVMIKIASDLQQHQLRLYDPTPLTASVSSENDPEGKEEEEEEEESNEEVVVVNDNDDADSEEEDKEEKTKKKSYNSAVTSSQNNPQKKMKGNGVSFVLFNGETTDNDELAFHRSFLWGRADVLNPDHSDFLSFKEALFEDCVEDLIDITKYELYEDWRTGILMKKTASLHLQKQRMQLSMHEDMIARED